MLTKRGFLTVCLLITLIAYCYGDNPVMCTLHQVKGQWLFTFGTQTIKKETKDYDKFSCGRHQPTKLVEFNSDPGEQQRFLNELQGVSADKAKESIRQVVFELTDYDNHVYQHQYDGENISAAQENVGNWTMLLHEGLLGFVFDQKLDQMIVFNSFWRYNLLDKSEKKYESICYETMVGWYHTINQDDPNSEDWGCFYAKKIDPTKEDLDQSKHFIFNGGRPVFTDKSNNNNKCINDLKSKALSGLLTWHTDSSRDIAKSANFAAFSPTLIEDSNGVPSSSKISRDNEGKLSGLRDYYYLVGKNPQDISDLELPHSLNWNNINGYSFFPEIVKQGCGNCYLIASIYSMESRIMIASNGKLKPKISIQQQMDCNWYAEGCVGGLPINVAKYGWEFEFVSEKCYSGVSSSKCDWNTINKEDCEKYYVNDFYFVGYNYGGASESLIMKEVMAHGPVASVLNAPAYLQMYKGGIILEECPISPDQIFKKTSPSYFKFQSGIGLSSHSTLWDKGIEYEFVNHSITILGWGAVDEDGDESVFMDDNVDCDEHKANSYWIVANSWGPAFGEDGFFRVRRGCDDFAIESEALAIIPLLNEDQLDDNFKNDKYLS